MTRLAEKLLDDFYDQPIQSDKWKNYSFDKSGKMYYTANVWPSEAMALQMNEYSDKIFDEKHAAAKKAGKTFYGLFANGKLNWDNYSHTLQLPYKE